MVRIYVNIHCFIFKNMVKTIDWTHGQRMDIISGEVYLDFIHYVEKQFLIKSGKQ